MSLFALAAAAVAGIAMAVQGALNSVMGKTTGLLEATVVVHVLGAATATGLLFLVRLGPGELGRIGQVPWWALLGGPVGVVIIYGVVASIPRVGVALATTAIIVGQVAMAMLIDQFGLFGLKEVPFTWWKVVGLALLAAGARLMLN
ncbi:MAG: DMT family transporter [Clostridia bacterium]|nr:MAG: DMT family transporter [Clostridia bacterium]